MNTPTIERCSCNTSASDMTHACLALTQYERAISRYLLNVEIAALKCEHDIVIEQWMHARVQSKRYYALGDELARIAMRQSVLVTQRNKQQ